MLLDPGGDHNRRSNIGHTALRREDSRASSIQINPNSEEFCSEEAHRPRIPGAAWQLIRQPALTLTRIIVGEQMSSARVPSSSKSVTQFQSYTRINFNIADVSRLHAMFRY
jgi:hypothetical protein